MSHDVCRATNLSLSFALCLRRFKFKEERQLRSRYISRAGLLFVSGFVAGVPLLHESVLIIGERRTSSHCERRRVMRIMEVVGVLVRELVQTPLVATFVRVIGAEKKPEARAIVEFRRRTEN